MTPPTTPRFNLVDEPWIPVRYLDGEIAEASLRAVFHDAHRIRELDGELPTQVFAITRLLLAVLYRATATDDDPAWSHAQWESFWSRGLPLAEIDRYLDAWHDRLWLLHPERPFFQVPDLATGSGEVKDTAALILDVPSKPLFTNRSGAAALRLPFAEAARWLVNAHAFDPSGIKSGAVGDPRVKGGKGYPMGQGWAGHLGGVLLDGDHLAQSLLLNLVVPGDEFTIDADTDVPPWEDDEADTATARPGLRPVGPIRLFTWQSRRIRLVAEGDAVVGCVLAYGDPLTPQNRFRHEPMTAWRYSEPQTKRAGVRTFMPREHRAGRAFWRGIAALLPARGLATDKLTQQPATLAALNDHRLSDRIPDDMRIGVRAIGVLYGTQQAVVDDIVDDRLDIAIALLRNRNAALATEAENAVGMADDGVRALRRLAENLVRAAGGSPDDAAAQRAQVEAAAYAALDGVYRAWLAGLDAETSPEDAIARWRRAAHRLLREHGRRLVRDAPPAAWTGREVRTLAGRDVVNTPRAEIWFLNALHTALGAERRGASTETAETLEQEVTT